MPSNGSERSGADSAQQILAEVGLPQRPCPPRNAPPREWVLARGEDKSAPVSHSQRSPRGTRDMRRLLNQGANAAVKAKGSIFEIFYRRSVRRPGHHQAIRAIAHRQCRLMWLMLHQGVRYEERGPAINQKPKSAHQQEASDSSKRALIGSNHPIPKSSTRRTLIFDPVRKASLL